MRVRAREFKSFLEGKMDRDSVEKMLWSRAEKFFEEGLHNFEFEDLADRAAERLSNGFHAALFFRYKLHEDERFSHWTPVALKKSLGLFFDYTSRINQIPEAVSAVEELIRNRPEDFFLRKFHKHALFEHLALDAARRVQNFNEAHSYRAYEILIKHSKLHKDERFYDIVREVVSANATPSEYFFNGHHDDECLSSLAGDKVKKLIELSPFGFFLYKLHNDQRFVHLAEEAAMNVAKTSEEMFFKLGLDKDKRFGEAFLYILKNLDCIK